MSTNRTRWMCNLILGLGLLSWMVIAGGMRSLSFQAVEAAKVTAGQVSPGSQRDFGPWSQLNLVRLGQGAATSQVQDLQPTPALTSREVSGGQTFAGLMVKAQAAGAVRVIVGLRVAFQPEGTLATLDAVQAQQFAIAQAQTTLLNQMAGYNVTGVKQFPSIPFLALEVDAAGLQYLASAPEVTGVQEDKINPLALAESVPLIGAPAAWASGFTGAGQTVAILDSGVDKTHPFLAGKVVSEACYSTTSSSAGTSSVCPGGVANSTATGAGVNCTAAGCEHGTHVAGIAAGKGSSFSGVAKDANLIAVQVSSKLNTCPPSPNPCVGAFDSDIILGLQRVQTLSSSFNIAAVNLSIGGGGFSSNCDAAQAAFKSAIDNLRSLGIATVVASGNESSTASLSSPACISSAISVGSTGDGSNGATQDAVSSFSNSAPFLNLLAPGQWINSSVPGGGFANFAGTSMSAPHVTGAWAVLKSKSPNATVAQILSALSSTGLPVTDARNSIIKPRIKLDAAVNALSSSSCSLTLSSTTQSFTAAAGTGTVNVTAGAGCAWTASSNNAWLSVTSGSSGNGNGAVNYSVATNTGAARTGTLFIAGQTFIITQAANPQTATLAVDDGSIESALGLTNGGTLTGVNRLTPPSYPATLNAVSIYMPAGFGLSQGQSLTVLAGGNPSGSSSISGISLQSTSASVQSLGQFNVFTVPSITITSGDFVVGMRITHAAGTGPFAKDNSSSRQRRSYVSTDGFTFTIIDDLGVGGNLMIRALVTLEPVACPTVAGINPSSGGTGSSVTITGTNLTGVTGVKFSNNVTATFTVVNDTTLTTTVPSGAVTGPITLSKQGCPDAQTGTFNVTQCPTITLAPTTLPVGTLGTAYAQNITASGGTAPYNFTLSAGTLPNGLTLSSSGLLSGTPTRAGSFNFTLKATDATGCTGTQAYTLVINCTATITLAPATLPDGVGGTAYSQTITASGGTAPFSFAVTSGTLPGGLTLTTSGVLSGTPIFAGTFNFTVTATDANGCTGTRSYTINITIPSGTQTGVLYVLNDNASGNQIYGYAVNETTGALTLLSGFPVSTGGSGDGGFPSERLAIDRANQRLYAINSSSNTVSAYAINPTTGALIVLPFSPINLGSGGWRTITVHPSGSPLVVGDVNRRLLSYQITATTATAAVGSPYSTGSASPWSAAFSQGGNYIYTGGGISSNNFSGFSVNAATGVLTALTGSPFDSGNDFPSAYATDAAGRLFMSHPGGIGRLRVFTTASGIPSAVSGNPFTSGLTDSGHGLLHPSGFYIVTGRNDNRVGVYQISGSGSATTLAAVTGSPFAAGGTLPHVLALTQTGAFLFAANGDSRNLTTFSVNASTGALTALSTQSANTLGTSGRLTGMAYLPTVLCPTITLSPTTLPAGTLNTAYNQTLTASGGATPYSFTLSAGTLPNGLTLSSSGVLSGTPTQGGSFNITVKVTDANNCTGTQVYTLVINCPTITLSPTTLPGGTTGTAYNQTISASPSGTYTFAVTAGSLPAGLSLNSTTGAITGTPTTAGTSSFTITATSFGACTGSQAYTINIQQGVACPTITSINPTSGAVGAQVTITGTNFTGVGSVKFASNVAASFTINSNTQITATVPGGAVTGAITLSKAGCGDVSTAPFTVTAAASNSFLYVLNQRTTTQNLLFGFSVNEMTGALTALPGFPISAGGTGTDGTTSEQITIDRVNGRLYVINDGSDNLSVFSINPTTGKLTPLPFSPIDLGAGFWATVAVHPSGSPLLVGDANSPGRLLSYRITATTATQANGSPYSLDIVSPFSTAFSQDGNYVYTGGNNGNNFAGFSVNAANGVLSTIPGSSFNSGNPFPVAYATDTAGRLFMANFTAGQLRVFTTTSGVPNIVSGGFFTSGLTQAIQGLLHPNGFYLVADRGTLGTPPGNRIGVYKISGSGSSTTLTAVTGSPFAAGGTFTDALALNQAGTFLYAANGETRNLSTFSVNPTTGVLTLLNVQPTDALEASGRLTGLAYLPGVTCPTITLSPATLPSGTVGTAYNQTISALPAGTYTFALTAGSLPAGLSLNSTTGAITGTPTTTGTSNFTLTATSASSCTGSQAYTINIQAACPAITSISPTSGVIGSTVTITGIGFTGLSAGAVKFSGNVTATFTVVNDTTITAIVPSGAVTGPITISKTGCPDVQSASFTVTCPTITIAPATLAAGTVGAAYNQTFTASGGTASYSFTLSAGTLPTGLTLSSAGALSGTPTQSGNFNITVKATDANGCTGTQAYTLVINCPTITLSPATLPDRPGGVAYSQTLTASGGATPFSFAVTAGALPGGLTLASGGVLSGTPNVAGAFNFTVTATDTNGCKGTRSYTVNITVTLGAQTRALYVLNDCDGCANQIYGYTVNETTGALTLIPGFPVQTGGNGNSLTVSERLTIDKTNQRIYAINGGSNTVSAYKIDSVTGTLTPLPFSPISLSSGNWDTIAVHPSGSPLVIGDGGIGRLLSYQITATTATAAAGSPYSMGSAAPFSAAFSQDGKYVYAGGNSSTTIAGFNVNVETGVLTTIVGSPFDSGGISPSAYATDAMGRLFVGNKAQVRVFTTASGIPSAVSGNPFASGLTNTNHGLLHPNGLYLVADRNDNKVGVYRVNGNGSATTLTAVTGSPFAAGGSFTDVLALNQTGAFLFAANGSSRNLTTFSINPTTGALTALGTQPANTLGTSGRLTGMAYFSSPCSSITLSPATLPNGTVNTAYNQTISASPSGAYTFTVTAGSLPAGLSLNSTTGAITGTPTAAGTSNFTITALSFGPCSGSQAYTINITSACVPVSLSNSLTGSLGSTLTVPITVGDLTGKNVASYDFTLSFDPAVVKLSSTPTDQAGTLSSSFNVATNTNVAGQIRVSAFGTVPLAGAGTLLNLKFDVIGAVNACSDLTWVSFSFNEGTPCATTSNGRVCLAGGAISGTVNYGTSTTPKPVPDVTLTAAGTPSFTSTTNSAGTYSLTGLGGGPYTVTPSKTGAVNGISALDASLVAQFAAGLLTLTPQQLIAADASGNGTVSAFDAALIAQTAAGIANPGLAGTWKFTPANRSYPTLSGNQTNQNFDAILVGDVSGNWTPPAAASTTQLPVVASSNRAITRSESERPSHTLPIRVTLKPVSGAPGETVTVPITVDELSGWRVLAYDLTLSFDPSVLQLQSTATEASGTLSEGLSIVVNSSVPGQLRISAFGTAPLAGAGTLLKLKFKVIGETGTQSALRWQSCVFNEGEVQVRLVDRHGVVSNLDPIPSGRK